MKHLKHPETLLRAPGTPDPEIAVLDKTDQAVHRERNADWAETIRTAHLLVVMKVTQIGAAVSVLRRTMNRNRNLPVLFSSMMQKRTASIEAALDLAGHPFTV